MFEVRHLEADPALQLAPDLMRYFWFLRIGHYTSDMLDEWLGWYDISANDKRILLSDHQEILKTFGDQIRRSGAPSVDHPISVMLILLIALKVTKLVMLRSAQYHDVLEDFRRGKNAWTRERLKRMAGEDVMRSVSRLTKRARSATLSKEQVEELYRSTMMGASADEVLLKSADWFHNLATPWNLDHGHLTAKAYQTIYFYIPLVKRHKTRAHREMARYLSIQAKHMIEFYKLDVRLRV